MKRETLQRIVVFLIKTLTNTEFFGAQNVPGKGGVIVAINHTSHMDTPLLMANPTRPDITALVTTKYKKKPLVAWFTNTGKGIWINRDIADFTAIRKAAKVLDEGVALGIAPEGTRSKNGKLQEGKPGTIMLAVKTGVPIVPVGITGAGTALRELSHLRRPKLTVRFGKPFTIPSFERGRRSQDLRHWTRELMLRIAELLPEDCRGVYSE